MQFQAHCRSLSEFGWHSWLSTKALYFEYSGGMVTVACLEDAMHCISIVIDLLSIVVNLLLPGLLL